MESLGTKTSIKLLKALLEEPLHEFKEIELIRKAKTGKGSASNLINNLIEEGIVVMKKVGKTKIVSLNTENKSVFLLKNLFDQKKIIHLSDSKLASIILFKNKIKEKTKLIILFGSCISKTYSEKSDIDLLIVNDDLDRVLKERKKIEELFGEKFNLHYHTKKEIKEKIKTDVFIQNALLKGVTIYGIDLGKELFSSIKKGKDPERLFFFNERIKSAIRNYLNKDYKTTKEIIERTLEQIIFYLLSERKIGYISKKDALNSIKKLSEGKIIQKINKASLKEKISLSEKFILNLLKNKLLRGEGYVHRRN